MAYNFTQEEIAGIIGFVNGENDGNSLLNTDVPKRFLSFSSAFQAKVLDKMYSARNACRTKEKTIERMQRRFAGNINANQFGEIELNSIDVALAIIYLLRKIDRYESPRQVNFIMYHFYARWLHETQTRPWEVDRPALQEWGPQFWSAWNKLQRLTYGAGTYDDYAKLCVMREVGPMLGRILSNVVYKYAPLSEREMQKTCIDSFPYQNSLKRKNESDGKWGEKIYDSDLFWWKQ